MEEIKLNQDEIKKLVDLRTEVSNLYIQIGQLYVQRKEMLDDFDKKEKELMLSSESLKKKETKLYNEIGDRYGYGNVNLETGVFTPLNPENNEEV